MTDKEKVLKLLDDIHVSYKPADWDCGGDGISITSNLDEDEFNADLTIVFDENGKLIKFRPFSH